ncbi:zinc-ribbon domain-containing protein [Flavobacterium sp.]|uniref:zinc-ribbon domain-containing protein n=1 Tax=Flavobacterium sp. TaxID=239 RepID=UPI00375167F7
MFFLLGTNSYTIKKGTIDNVVCPICRCITKLNYSVHSRYTQITLIPVFPVDKYAVVSCKNCNTSIELDELDESTLSKLALQNNNLKSPIWMFFGNFVIVCSIFYGIYSYFKFDSETDSFIKKPTVDDVYYCKDSKGYYSTFKIDKVSKDIIFATQNEYQTDLPYTIKDIDKLENYANSKIFFSKKELLKSYNDGEIISIKRN